MWNLTDTPFPPSPCHPASPGPTNYSPKRLNLSHSWSMAHSVRKEAHTTNLEAPGMPPGNFSYTGYEGPNPLLASDGNRTRDLQSIKLLL